MSFKDILWLTVGLGVVGAGLYFYAYNRDPKDPMGVFQDFWNDNFVEGGKFIVPKSLRTAEGGIKPRNLDKRTPKFDSDYFNR